MKTMRLLLRDRASAGAIAVLIAFSLLLQGLLAGMAQGVIAASAVDPLHVICTSSGAVSVAPGNDQGSPPGKVFDCPCATLCRLAATAMPAVIGAQVGPLDPIASHEPIELHFAPVSISLLALRGLIGEARAPPVSL
jgi:hypothetical protein